MISTTRADSRRVLVALFCIVLSNGALAQGGRSDDNILYPQPLLPLLIGPELGWGTWQIDASFVVGDAGLACAIFADGEGEGPTIGMRSLLYVTPWIALSPRLRYEPRVATFLAPLEPEPARDSRDSIVMVEREGQADATISTFTFDLRVAVDFFGSGFYVAAGPALSLVASSFYDYTERIVGPQEFVSSSTGNTEVKHVASRAFENNATFVADARAGVGFALSLGRFVINPEVGYSYPLVSSLSAPDTMKGRGLSGSLGLLFNFGRAK
jgi:hypothetical protein